MHIVLSTLFCLLSNVGYGVSWESFHQDALDAVRGARHKIQIETPEFYDSELAIALALADFRGCKVDVSVKKALATNMRSIWPLVKNVPYLASRTSIKVDGKVRFAFEGPIVTGRGPIVFRQASIQPEGALKSTGTSRVYSYDGKSDSSRRRKRQRLPKMTIIQKAVSGGQP